MAEFAEVMRQAKRMCDACSDCYGCPFRNNDHQCKYTHLLDSDATFEDVTDFECIVMKWAAANPEPRYPAWREWQDANFPDALCDVCPKVFGYAPEEDCADISCEDCAKRSIPADIAKKLGIKPIGGCDNG